MTLPNVVEAGNGFSIQSAGNGRATLYIVGPGEALKREIQLGETTSFLPSTLPNAGHYLAVLVSASSRETGEFDVIATTKPANLSFLARPSRLPVSLHEGITGAVYVFDSYQNLIATPTPVSFELSAPSGTVQKRAVISSNGAAWTTMDSTAEQGVDRFAARVGDVSSMRIVAQVPGDPCGLKMNAERVGQQVKLITDPLRDCNGNAIPDGTVVTFSESYKGAQSTVDEPLKHGVAEVTMQVHPGARLTVASGVVVGNQIGWDK